jgi:hypothetical protein
LKKYLKLITRQNSVNVTNSELEICSKNTRSLRTKFSKKYELNYKKVTNTKELTW